MFNGSPDICSTQRRVSNEPDSGLNSSSNTTHYLIVDEEIVPRRSVLNEPDSGLNTSSNQTHYLIVDEEIIPQRSVSNVPDSVLNQPSTCSSSRPGQSTTENDLTVSPPQKRSIGSNDSIVNTKKMKIPLGTNPNQTPKQKLYPARRNDVRPEEYDVGEMKTACPYCGALHFGGEKNSHKTFSSCCRNGQVEIPPTEPYPTFFFDLLTGKTDDCKNFKKNVRKYNNACALASFGHQPVSFKGGPQAFAIHGQVYHRTSEATDSETPLYSQLYILDPEFATEKRMGNSYNKDCKENIMRSIDELLRKINPYVRAYQMMKEVIERSNEMELDSVSMWIVRDRQKDARTYNLPVVNEVAAVFKSEEGEPPFQRDICIYPRSSNELKHMKIISPNCDPMTYPILFPHGEFGWQPLLPRKKGRSHISMQEFYGYRLQERLDFSPLLHAGKLTQQFIVDAYLKIEASRLQWYRDNQATLRCDQYLGLMDYVNNEAENQHLKAGKMYILPSSFSGSKRALEQEYQDAMAMVAKFGRPDLFITFTCNPNWKEIKSGLRYGELAIDRPDIVATVFHLKLRELMTDIVKKKVLGGVRSFIYVIEFQKRGLPHCHMLVILDNDSKIREPGECDTVVSAEIPDKVTDPDLYEIVKATMVHGPCGHHNTSAPCMQEVDGTMICTKKFPKDFIPETNLNVNGYPLYRRKNDGKSIQIRDTDIDNRWIVPYNAFLTRKYNAHINVEICSSVKSVKYIFKYVYKGHDAAVVRVCDNQETLEWDEIKMYLDTRYIAAPEAMWRLREYKMHDRMHSIQRLAVHLPDMQSVIFKDGNERDALDGADGRETTLTAWFRLNQENLGARKYLYTDIPLHFIFSPKRGWQPRKYDIKVLPRMYSVSPKDMERFCLRLLLLHVRGAQSYEDLKTVDGIEYGTFKEAARALNLLDDDTECYNAMEEASLYQMPHQLRSLFSIILITVEPTDPKVLYNNFRLEMMEDYVQGNDEYVAEQLCLQNIQENLSQFGRNCYDYDLPMPDLTCIPVPNLETNINDEIEAERLISSLNEEQKVIYDRIMDSITKPSGQKCFYLSGAGGCGKTYIYKALISTLLGKNEQVKVVAPTGLAATLLRNGQTVHSGFRLPFNVNETSVTSITHQSKEWASFKNVKLIIWDEISMCHVHLFKAVDRSLKDLFRSSEPFGGIPIVVGGDFRQQAPVVKHGSRVKIVEACVKTSENWKYFNELKLTRNMRVTSDEIEFQKWLLTVGSGLNLDETHNDYISIPDDMISNNIVEDVFGQDINKLTHEEIAERAILCPKNEDTFTVNEKILHLLNGESRSYYSYDSVVEKESDDHDYPIEFLNSLTPMGMPPHLLSLKQNCCVMLLRNLNPKQGLCNGTRLIVNEMGDHVLKCSVFSGENKGRIVFIPRISLDVKDSDIPFEFRRKQFPLRLAYSMTITKSQGQTFEKIGLYLPSHVFTHGQLYTAFSRVKKRSGLKIQIVPTSRQAAEKSRAFTFNCVFHEIL